MQNIIPDVKTWYDQGDQAVCINFGLAMLFTYKTNVMIPPSEIANYTKTMQRKLMEGYGGYRCEFQELKKPTNENGVKSIFYTFGPLVAELRMFKEVDYHKDLIGPMPEKHTRSLGGHRLLALGYDYVSDTVLLANTWGRNKVQRMKLKDFFTCLNRFVFMGCFPVKTVKKPEIPMKYDHFGYDYLDPIKSSLGKGFHPGLDFNFGPSAFSDVGLPVLSVLDGKVVFSAFNGNDKTKQGWGNLIVIEHDYDNAKVYSRYAHLHTRFVRIGDIVKHGQAIGACGNTGASFGPHLHFDVFESKPKSYTQYVYGLRKESVQKIYLDPYNFLNINK
jgi:murein DD-endopeptidase MepM/ murein hydrolase activator NlpD